MQQSWNNTRVHFATLTITRNENVKDIKVVINLINIMKIDSSFLEIDSNVENVQI